MASAADPDRFSLDDLAAWTGIETGTVGRFADLGLLARDAAGTFPPGDAHRARLIDAFEAAGVPAEVLARAERDGLPSLAGYADTQALPAHPSDRDYATVRAALGDTGDLLPLLFAAVGLAEPAPGRRLSVSDEELLTELARAAHDSGTPDGMLRVMRVFGEGARRASDGALSAYAQATGDLFLAHDGVPTTPEHEPLFRAWADMGRLAPELAAWLTRQHLAHAIDAFSVEVTEGLLGRLGYVTPRHGTDPAIAFIDLTGFTARTLRDGDEAAADLSLRLGELTERVVTPQGGRVVKLLGDGVLVRFPDAVRAVDGVATLLDRLPGAGLPTGHAGVHAGPVIARDGDVFGRTVNLAARIADVAPDEELYLTDAVAVSLDDARIEVVGEVDVQGVGSVTVHRLRRTRPDQSEAGSGRHQTITASTPSDRATASTAPLTSPGVADE